MKFLLPMFCSALIVTLVAGTTRSEAETKSTTWMDLNYVPCEGMGATASGTIQFFSTFTSTENAIRVTELHITSRYLHPHSPSARVTYDKPAGGTAVFNLQTAWFPTIGPDDGSKTLYLPKSSSSAEQTPFVMKPGGALKVALTALFPQDGGNCVSTFEKSINLP